MSDKVGSQMIAAETDEQLGETLDLFAEPETVAGEAKLGERAKRRAGRPPGARNKFNERALTWLRSRYPDARERMLAIATGNTADMAALWGCTMLEAQQEQRLCAAIVLPFVAQKQPLAINLETRQAVHLHIHELDADDLGADLELTPQSVTVVEIQQLSAPPDAADRAEPVQPSDAEGKDDAEPKA